MAKYLDQSGVTTLAGLIKDEATNLISITYSALKTLRNNSGLKPGRWYRITDYATTTTQTDTMSAGNAFDVIVLATAINELSEEARAGSRAGTSRFSRDVVESWKIWYCLDNDTDRFAWADTTNGKGVIYRMIDEHGNDCPYDFKNIKFKRYKVSSFSGCPSLQSYYYGTKDGSTYYPKNATVSSSDYVWRYTFDANGDDYSYRGYEYYCHGNKIEPWYINSNQYMKQSLNNIVFYARSTSVEMLDNHIGGYCRYMTFDNCSGIDTGIFCKYIFLGNGCSKNKFGHSCNTISFADACQDNIIGNGCNNIIFSKIYTQRNAVDTNNQYITLTSTVTTSSSALLRNVHITSGCNVSTTTKSISHNTTNDVFNTTYQPANSQVISV